MIKLTYNPYQYSLDILCDYDPNVLKHLKATFPKREFIDREKVKCWRIPLTTPGVKTLMDQFVGKLPNYRIEVEEILTQALEVADGWKAENYRLTSLVDYHNPTVDRALNGTLSASERVIAAYLTRNSKGVLAACLDDTIYRKLGVAFVQILDLFPLLVLCRNEYIYHWAFEIKRTLGKNVFTASEDQAIVSLIRDDQKPMSKAEAAVINFGNLPKFQTWARSIAWKCIIIDEANLFQDSKSQQYQAVYALNRDIPHRLLLTDYQSKLYPWRLVKQLTLANRLEDFGYTEGEFMRRYCPVRGGSMHVQNLDELEQKLFETCYVEYPADPFSPEA